MYQMGTNCGVVKVKYTIMDKSSNIIPCKCRDRYCQLSIARGGTAARGDGDCKRLTGLSFPEAAPSACCWNP